MRFLALLTLLALSTLPTPFTLLAGSTPLELSTSLSKDYQQRLKEQLDRLLGAGKSEVFVNIEMDFAPGLKSEFEKTLRIILLRQLEEAARRPEEKSKTEAAVSTSAAAAQAYNWLFPGLSQGGGENYILPGFPIAGDQSRQTGKQQEERESISPAPTLPALPFADPQFLYSIGLEVKKITIRVILDNALPADMGEKVRTLVKTLVPVDEARGDIVDITRSIMPSPIQEIWRDVGFLTSSIKWGLLAVVIIFGVLVLGIVLLSVVRTSGVSLERSAAAVAAGIRAHGEAAAAAQQVSAGTSGATTTGGLPAPPGVIETTAIEEKQKAQLSDTTIRIPSDRVAELYHLLAAEEPKNIALVVARLEPTVREELLKRFDNDKISNIISALANPQYIETSMLARLKEEIERRVSSVVGGEEAILRTIQESALDIRAKIFKALEEKDREFYLHYRSKILLFEDLERFNDADLSRVVAQMPMEDLALAIADGLVGQSFKDKVMNALPKRSQTTLTEMLNLQGTPAKVKIMQAQSKVLALVEKMIREGTLENPLKEMTAALEGPK